VVFIIEDLKFMTNLFENIDRIRGVMGLIQEESSPLQMSVNLRKTVDVLKYLKLYNQSIENLLMNITVMSKSQIIDFGLLERGIKKVLLKKGDRRKNVEEYLTKILFSLKNRSESDSDEPDTSDYEFEEPSIIPKKVYRKELFDLQVELLRMQEWLRKTGRTVIVVFEGRDSAGKGSTIKKFVENLNPRYYNVVALGIPTPEDRKNWWDRYKKEIKPGMINLFDRSWYNRGLIEPVMGYGSPEEYEDFMENVADFEQDLVKEGDYLFKLWFSIEKDTQKRRFDIRQKSPLKYWKYSPNDEKMQDLWDRFTEFKEKLFDKTSTLNHPWVIIDSEDKRVSGLNAIRYILKNVPYEPKNTEALDVEYPEALAVLRPQE
jgi:polyphosphate kinase 2